MLLPQTTRISIESGVNYYTAVFKRVYTLQVSGQNDHTAVITVKCQDYAPSGYAEGGTQKILIESEEFKIPTHGITAKAWLASLAVLHDKSFGTVSGCVQLNKSLATIRTKLVALTNSKVI